MKTLIVGDIHIGKGTSIGKDPIGVGLNSRVEDQKSLLDFVLSTAINNSVAHIILVGDIWQDVNPKSVMVKVFFEWVKKVIEKNIKIIITMGNHDFVRSGSDKVSMMDSLKVLELDGVQIITDLKSLIIDNINFVCVPFTDRKQLKKDNIQEAINYLSLEIKKLYKKNKKNIVVGHIAIDGSLWVGDELDEDSNEIFLPISTFNGVDFVWMGHIHKWQVLSKKPHIAHIGSLDKTSFGEGDKFIALYDSKTNKESYIKLPCRNLVDIKINLSNQDKNSTEIVLKELQKYEKEDFKDSIVRVSIKIKSHDTEETNKEDVLNVLTKYGMFHLCAFNETKDVDRVLVKEAELDESIDHFKAIDIFVNSLESVNDGFKDTLKNICKSIVKEFEIKVKK